jgi:hypothetical protein
LVLDLVQEGIIRLHHNCEAKTDGEREEELAWLTGLRLFKPMDPSWAWTDLLVRLSRSALGESIDYTDAAQSLADSRVAGCLEAQLLLAAALQSSRFSMSAFSRILAAFEACPGDHDLEHLLCLYQMRETFGQAALPHPLDTLVQWRVVQLLEQAGNAAPPAWMSWMGDPCVEICLTRGQPVPDWLLEDAETKLAGELAATYEALDNWPSAERAEAGRKQREEDSNISVLQ